MGEPTTIAAPTEVPATAPFDESAEPIIIQEISLPTSPPPPPPPLQPTDVPVKEAGVVQCAPQPTKRKRGRPRKVVVVARADAATNGNEPPFKRQKREISQPPHLTPVFDNEDPRKSLQARRGAVILPKIIIPPSTTQSPFPLTVKLVIMR